jgi:hypothetical protein
MAPEEAWTHHDCGDFSGVNGTPLLRGIEFTHAPAQAGERMAESAGKARWKILFLHGTLGILGVMGNDVERRTGLWRTAALKKPVAIETQSQVKIFARGGFVVFSRAEGMNRKRARQMAGGKFSLKEKWKLEAEMGSGTMVVKNDTGSGIFN